MSEENIEEQVLSVADRIEKFNKEAEQREGGTSTVTTTAETLNEVQKATQGVSVSERREMLEKALGRSETPLKTTEPLQSNSAEMLAQKELEIEERRKKAQDGEAPASDDIEIVSSSPTPNITLQPTSDNINLEYFSKDRDGKELENGAKNPNSRLTSLVEEAKITIDENGKPTLKLDDDSWSKYNSLSDEDKSAFKKAVLDNPKFQEIKQERIQEQTSETVLAPAAQSQENEESRDTVLAPAAREAEQINQKSAKTVPSPMAERQSQDSQERTESPEGKEPLRRHSDPNLDYIFNGVPEKPEASQEDKAIPDKPLTGKEQLAEAEKARAEAEKSKAEEQKRFEKSKEDYEERKKGAAVAPEVEEPQTPQSSASPSTQEEPKQATKKEPGPEQAPQKEPEPEQDKKGRLQKIKNLIKKTFGKKVSEEDITKVAAQADKLVNESGVALESMPEGKPAKATAVAAPVKEVKEEKLER